MSNNTQKKKRDLKKFLQYRSSDYAQFGRYLVSDFDFKTVWLRILSQLGDIVIILLPLILWIIAFLLTTTGLFSIKFFYSLTPFILILVLISMIVGNLVFIILFKGQSFGKLAMGIKVVAINNKELDTSRLIIREAFGRVVPLVVLYLLFGILGIIGFYAVDGLIVLVDIKYHRNFMDFILKSKVVILDSSIIKKHEDVKVEQKPEEVIEEVENNYDLHLYSSFSHDGEESVEDLFKKAKEAGLSTISITDHNSVKANINAKHLAKLYKLNYIDGINIDCQYEGKHVRLLGYFMDSSDPRYTTIEHENLAKEKAISNRRIMLFEEFTGLKIDVESLMKFSRFQVVSPETIARQILTNVAYEREKLLYPYLYGDKRNKPIKSFIEDFFGKGKPAYVPIAYPELIDMINLVKTTGGVCVLAHPMYSLREQVELLDEIIPLGIQGLEVFTPKHTKEEENYLLSVVKKYSLGVSAGSEYHGGERKEYRIGETTCPKEAEALVQKFVNTYQKKV